MAAAVVVGVLLGPLALGCAGADSSADEIRTLTVWRHNGTEAESTVFDTQVRSFNATHPTIRVVARTIPEGDYNDELQAAAAGRQLPDVVEIDGPLIDSYVYQEQLRSLEGLIDASVLAAQLPSLQTQGEVRGHTYAVGVFDSGLGLYADRRQLEAAGITSWPTAPDEAWTADELTGVLRALAARDRDGKVLDLKVNYGVGEWLTYGFAPLVASAGGALIDPETLTPTGHFDAPATRIALSTLARWARYVDPDTDDDAFSKRTVALSWVGHWVYPDYAAALGDDLLVLPLPDLGNGTKSGQGSWAWAVTRQVAHDDAAAEFLEYLLTTEEILRMTDANGAVPGTRDALDQSKLYSPTGPLRLFAQQLLASCDESDPTPECVSAARPATPGYPTLSAQFATAVSRALTGGDWREALRTGAGRVQDDLDANAGYR